MPIKVLTPEVVSKIAAGEVIERPASVVKELVENSLDAGASEINVETRGGGVELIRVSDNGIGIPASELELAFHRYATSKITDLVDLEDISSLGFRGEALPSIAAVAEVEILTRAPSEAIGSYICLKKGEIVARESRPRQQGTTVVIRRLFRYLPARLKFLKSAATENSHIAYLVNQYALAFPEVRFSLITDKRNNLSTQGDGSLRNAVSQIYGLEFAQRMLGVEEESAFARVNGLVSPPSLNRTNRSYLTFFVNRRWIHSPLLTRAAEEAYHGLLMEGRHPVVILNLSLPGRELDINVHPTKAQVKFHNEQVMFVTIKKAIREALSKASMAKPIAMPAMAGAYQQRSFTMVSDKEPTFTAPLPTLSLPILRVIGQLSNTYIIAEGPEGLYLIDQHAAHERILYERVLAQWSRQEVEVQGLLEPITIELNPREEEILRANKDMLAQFGFDIEPFGDKSYLIRTIPALATRANLDEVMSAVLSDLDSKDEVTSWEQKIAQSLACHSAIRAGQQLSNEEMLALIRQLEQANQPRTCPHGRPTMIQLTSYQLEKEFGRAG
jgi:DNA mismatch repair protein MutL